MRILVILVDGMRADAIQNLPRVKEIMKNQLTAWRLKLLCLL